VPKLLLDEHLPPELAEALCKRGLDAIAVTESGLAGLPDEQLFVQGIAQAIAVHLARNYSETIGGPRLTKPPRTWTHFISKVALDFHKQDRHHRGNGITP
jgi:hypothetical protein